MTSNGIVAAKRWIWRDAFVVDEKEMAALVLPKYSLEQIVAQYEAAVKACKDD
jgi:hypothetical protein